jgi:hypothetical protein
MAIGIRNFNHREYELLQKNSLEASETTGW